jgi:3-oxoacyl-[acyl-carrier-protein] synthase-3
MATLKTNNVKMSGLCCALPGEGRSIYDVGKGYFTEEVIEKTAGPIGVETLYFADAGQTASDLCFAAAEHLIEKLQWSREEIDGLLFVSQTPDYKTPATACILQDRLTLSKNCLAMDINFGCSGFAYGYYVASSLIESGACNKILLLVGDTLRDNISLEDKGLTFIIGDAGSATAIERTDIPNPTTLIVKTDGSGYKALIIPAGGARNPIDPLTSLKIEDEDGSKRSAEDLFMDGLAVFTFVVKEIPLLIDELSASQGIPKEDFDYYLMHQANAYMIKYIAKRSKVPLEKFPINIEKYGNTNGSTIPFLICDLAAGELAEPHNVIMSGFGVGLSWGGIATKLGALECADIIQI